MKINKNILIIIIFSYIFSSCGVLKESGKILRNEKTSTTDEFLIKKKDPLTTPPDFDKLPIPSATKKKVDNSDNSLKRILNSSEAKNKKTLNKSSDSIEKSIIEKIRR